MTYINCKYLGEVETVDEFETWKEARAMINEYHMASPEQGYYLSQRSTREWKQ